MFISKFQAILLSALIGFFAGSMVAVAVEKTPEVVKPQQTPVEDEEPECD
jgi:hypothetical protein